MPDLTEHRQLRGRVLIAEDNPANQLIISSFLARLGLNTDVVANGLEAVQAVRGNPYDLVLMDVGMPKMDGVAATQAIRALEGPPGRIPIVAVTAHVMRGERESLLQQGMDDYLSKPIDRAALVDCLARWLPAEKEPAAEGRDPDASPLAPTLATLVDREVLEQLLQDVGPENARAVVDAFVGELDRQAAALESAANTADLAAMAQAAHRLKGSAASFGAVPLSRVLASVEQAARRGDSEAAMATLNGCLGLARDSGVAMATLREEIFSPAGEAVQA
jgi:CheY-like chemotaxis protein/HPt (histidine-containing phosphotransfer) domain-containing protein